MTKESNNNYILKNPEIREKSKFHKIA